MVVIETARFRLRRACPSDLDAMVAALSDWAVSQWLIRPPFPYMRADGEAFLARAQPPAPLGSLVIADRTDDVCLGQVGLAPDGERLDLGYWLRPQAQGRGVATEAAAALLDVAAAQRWVSASTDPENAVSRRVLTRLGFTLAGEEIRAVPNRRGAAVAVRYERAPRFA